MFVFDDGYSVNCFVDVVVRDELGLETNSRETLLSLLDKAVVAARVLNSEQFTLEFESRKSVSFRDDRTGSFESFLVKIDGKEFVI